MMVSFKAYAILLGILLECSSVRIKDSIRHFCVEAVEKTKYGVQACTANSTSLEWILDGEHIKNVKLQTCLSNSGVKNRQLTYCGSESKSTMEMYNKTSQEDLKMKIEHTKVKNYLNQCLLMNWMSNRMLFGPCKSNTIDKLVIFEK
jgi:hypothetical protein